MSCVRMCMCKGQIEKSGCVMCVMCVSVRERDTIEKREWGVQNVCVCVCVCVVCQGGGVVKQRSPESRETARKCM